MPSPPLLLLCAAGVGLAALLYYYFAAREENERMGQTYSSQGGGGRPRPRRQRCDSRYGPDECSICQEVVYKPLEMSRLACGHNFHYRCIEKWLEASPVPTTCPNCRQIVH